MEADIKMCEELLAQDSFGVKGTLVMTLAKLERGVCARLTRCRRAGRGAVTMGFFRAATRNGREIWHWHGGRWRTRPARVVPTPRRPLRRVARRASPAAARTRPTRASRLTPRAVTHEFAPVRSSLSRLDLLPDAPARASAASELASDAAAAASGRLSASRRNEIMDKIEKHKHRKGNTQDAYAKSSYDRARTTAAKDGDSMTAAERRERVQQLLLERQQRLSASARKSAPAAGGDGWDSPETRGGGTNRVSAFGLPSHPGNGFKTPSNQRAARSTTPGTTNTVTRRSYAGQNGSAMRANKTSAWGPRPQSAPRPSYAANADWKPFNVATERKAGRHSKEVIAAKVAAEERENMTFKPRTNSARRSRPPTRMQNMSRQDHIEQLSTPRRALWERCEQAKLDARASETRECTFKPKVNRPKKMAETYGRGRRDEITTLLFPDRLYDAGKDKYRARENAKRQLAEAEVASFPFQPAINDNSRAAVEEHGYRPIHERVGDLLRKRQESMAAAKVQVELENPDLTFAPRVSQASRAIARGLEEEAGVSPSDRVDLLSKGVSVKSVRGGTYTRRKSVGAEEDYTFKPKLNENTRRLIDMMAEEGVRGGAGSFLERQQEALAKAEREKEQLRSLLDEDCTFHPNTGNADEVISTSKHAERLGETASERILRLSYIEKRERDAARERAHEENLKKIAPFKPRLSKSAKTKRATPLHELVENRKSEKRAALEQAAAEQWETEHTFEPNKGRKHSDAAPRPFQVDYNQGGGITARIREYRREKEICLQEARNEKEFKELEACTFQPNVGRKPTKGFAGTKSVVEAVPGLGRHLELRRRAKQMEDDAKARQAKVFMEDAATKKMPAHKQTVPRPYNISGYGEQAMKAELRRQR